MEVATIAVQLGRGLGCVLDILCTALKVYLTQERRSSESLYSRVSPTAVPKTCQASLVNSCHAHSFRTSYKLPTFRAHGDHKLQTLRVNRALMWGVGSPLKTPFFGRAAACWQPVLSGLKLILVLFSADLHGLPHTLASNQWGQQWTLSRNHCF